MKDTIYLCKYSSGSYEDYYQTTIFATKNLKTAENWVNKFNKKLEYWKEYYNQFTGNKWVIANIADEHLYTINADRYWQIIEIREAFMETIEIRK